MKNYKEMSLEEIRKDWFEVCEAIGEDGLYYNEFYECFSEEAQAEGCFNEVKLYQFITNQIFTDNNNQFLKEILIRQIIYVISHVDGFLRGIIEESINDTVAVLKRIGQKYEILHTEEDDETDEDENFYIKIAETLILNLIHHYRDGITLAEYQNFYYKNQNIIRQLSVSIRKKLEPENMVNNWGTPELLSDDQSMSECLIALESLKENDVNYFSKEFKEGEHIEKWSNNPCQPD